MAHATVNEVMGRHLELVPTNHAGVKAIAPPPAGFDPRTADVSTLLRYGIHPRPDPAKHPAATKLWDRLTAQPYKYVVPTLSTPRYKRVQGKRPPLQRLAPADVTTEYSPNWSGGLVFNPTPSEPFTWVQGEWVVPSVTPPAGGDGFWASVAWVGVDGYGSSDVMQLGTAQFVTSSNGSVSTETFAWIEWYTYGWQQLSFSVNPGDTIFAYIQSNGVVDGVLQAQGSIVNETQGTSTTPVVSAPPGTIFQGNVAEWIMERPTFSSLATIPRYGEVVFTSASTCAQGLVNYNIPAQPVNMTSDGTAMGKLLSLGAVNPVISSWLAST